MMLPNVAVAVFLLPSKILLAGCLKTPQLPLALSLLNAYPYVRDATTIQANALASCASALCH
jgi:hypothetical protein